MTTETTETTELPSAALLLMARAGLDLDVLETEIKFACIEATYEEEGAA